MKYLIILSFFFLSENYVQKLEILDNLILGESTIQSVSEYVDTSNIKSIYDNGIKIDTINSNNYYYKKTIVKVQLVFLNNKLFSVRYFPPNDDMYYKYEKYLNKNYKNKFAYKIWFYGVFDLKNTNNCILVEYDMVENFVDTFIHYDFGLAIRYPQYNKII